MAVAKTKQLMPTIRSTREGSLDHRVVLALFLLICLGTAVLGAAWTNLSVGDWYAMSAGGLAHGQ